MKSVLLIVGGRCFIKICKYVHYPEDLIERVAKEVPEAPWLPDAMRRKRIDICGPFLPINDDKRTEELTELRKRGLIASAKLFYMNKLIPE